MAANSNPCFTILAPKDTEDWFTSRGVDLKVENDGRMFPVSDDSQSIIDCLQDSCTQLGVKQVLNASAQSLHPTGEQWKVCFPDKEEVFDALIITTGGSPKEKGFDWLRELGHRIVTPVPSLFTFNMPKENITDLMGVVAQNTTVSIVGSKHKSKRPAINYPLGNERPVHPKSFRFCCTRIGRLPVPIHYKSTVDRGKCKCDLHQLDRNSTAIPQQTNWKAQTL